MTHLRTNNLVLIDWDDTLFPTSWIVKNSIDLTNKTTQHKYITLFSKLDNILYNFLNKSLKYANIVIITNAVKKWVELTLVMLPNTQKLMKTNVPIVSARDLYKPQYPHNMVEWKRKTFQSVCQKHFTDKKFQNIISIGDAEYEFLATVELYDNLAHSNKKLLKTVRLFSDPSFDSLINQIQMLTKSIEQIIMCDRHLDLKFDKS